MGLRAPRRARVQSAISSPAHPSRLYYPRPRGVKKLKKRANLQAERQGCAPQCQPPTVPMVRNTSHNLNSRPTGNVRACSTVVAGPRASALSNQPLTSAGRLARAHGCVKTLGCLATRARRFPGICTTAAPLPSSRGTRAGTCAERSARGCRTPPTATQVAAM